MKKLFENQIIVWILFIGASLGIAITMYLLFQQKVADIKGNGLSVQEMERGLHRENKDNAEEEALALAWVDSVKSPELLTQIDSVEAETRTLLTYLDFLTHDLENIGQLEPGTNVLNNPEETQENFAYWMEEEQANEGRGSGKAKELKDLLDGYSRWANAFIARNNPDSNPLPSLAELPADSGNSTWEFVTFHHETVAENLAWIEQLRKRVRTVRSACLQSLYPAFQDAKNQTSL